jgi:two-component sensor histidine kinase
LLTGDLFQILLVEDNSGDARLVQEMLQEAADACFALSHATRLGLANFPQVSQVGFAVLSPEGTAAGLIVNELVSNALQHAFPPDLRQGGIVRVALRAIDADRLALTVSDDGVGLPPALQLDSLQTLGLQLVDVLLQQLEGTIHLDGRSGTMLVITFPAHGRGGLNGEKG